MAVGAKAKEGTAVILMRQDGAFLMARRGRGCGTGQWSVPGGRREPGEELSYTAWREVMEEVGIDILTCRRFLVTRTNCHCGEVWDTTWFVSHTWTGIAQITEEATQIEWVTWEFMPDNIWITMRENLDDIRCLIS